MAISGYIEEGLPLMYFQIFDQKITENKSTLKLESWKLRGVTAVILWGYSVFLKRQTPADPEHLRHKAR
jgi:hypothetical protein